MLNLTECFVDESIHVSHRLFVLGLIFSDEGLDGAARKVSMAAGIDLARNEFKSSARMDNDGQMQRARQALLTLTAARTKVGVYIGRLDRQRAGLQSLQALQSILVRNGIDPAALLAYFDEGIFSSEREARRLFDLFHGLRGLQMHSAVDSKEQVGIQLADLVSHSFAQVTKELLDGSGKLVSAQDQGFTEGTPVSLGWSLLMQVRNALFTRPVIYDGGDYDAASDPVVLDPLNCDPVIAAQQPHLLGWGVQVDPAADPELRQAVEVALGQIWLGCIH